MGPSRRQMQPFTRRPWSGARPSATVLLIALSVAAFTAQVLVGLLDDRGLFHERLALSDTGVRAGRYWQFVTFPFLHAGPFHLLANILALYFAGREVEQIVGPRHFLALFFGANLLGGVTHWLLMPGFTVVGASAGVAAVIIAFATILPELEITLLLFFVLPLRLRAKYLGLLLVAGCAALAATWTAPAIGPVAMLAACALAWIYVKQLGFGNPLAIQRFVFDRRQRAARLDRMSPEQFVSAEIDPILDKISREGMHSLTRAERKILEKGREKIAKATVESRRSKVESSRR